MPASYTKRLEGKEKEVLDYIEKFGKYRAMSQYGLNSTIAFDAWLEKQGKSPRTFGYSPKIGDKNTILSLDLVIERFGNYIFELKTQLNEKQKEIDFLRLQNHDRPVTNMQLLERFEKIIPDDYDEVVNKPRPSRKKNSKIKKNNKPTI